MPTGPLLRLQRSIDVIVTWLDRGVFILCSGLLGFLVFALFIQVLFRYVIQQPLAWTEETAGFALVWYAMLAAGIAARQGQQFVFRWLAVNLPGVVLLVVRQAVLMVTLLFLCLLFAQSVGYLSVIEGQRSAAVQIDMRIPYAGIAVGVGYLVIVYAVEVFDSILGVVTKTSFSVQAAHEKRMGEMVRGAPSGPLG